MYFKTVAFMEKIERLLQGFSPISLEEMESVRLMNRIDTKYVTTLPELRQLLRMAVTEYRVQEIDGMRNMPYYTCYFDTPHFFMFHEHERGKSCRQKIRLRIYEESKTAFMEIKTKNNKGRTSKKRTQASQGYEIDAYNDFIRTYTPFESENLERQVENHFSRITLVNRRMTERLTIDTDLWFHNVANDVVCSLDELVIIELKRDGNVPSPVQDMLRQLHIHPCGFSKYCIGMAMTNHDLRQNRLKPKIMFTGKMCHPTISRTL